MKTNAIIRICIYSLLLVLLVGLLLGCVNNFRFFRSWGISTEELRSDWEVLSTPGSFEPREVSSLEIDWVSGNIHIAQGDVDMIMVHEQRDNGDKPMVVQNKNGTLKIDYCENEHVWFGIHSMPSKNLVITVPKDWNCRELDLDVASSKVTVLDLTIDEMEFDGASGDLELKNCTVGDLDIDTASGDVTFSGSLQTLDMDAASADFRGVFDNCPRRLTIDGASGDLDVTLPSGSGFTANVDGLSCSFHSPLPVNITNGAYIYGDGECKIDADGMSMDVTVQYAE